MRTATNVIIDSTLNRFHGVIELKSTDIDTKSSEKLNAISGQFATAPNCEGVCDQVFRPKMEASGGFWQVNNLVLDINGEGGNVLVQNPIGKTTGYYDGQFKTGDGITKIPTCETIAEGTGPVGSEQADISTGETACIRMISEGIHIKPRAPAEVHDTEVMTIGEGKGIGTLVK